MYVQKVFHPLRMLGFTAIPTIIHLLSPSILVTLFAHYEFEWIHSVGADYINRYRSGQLTQDAINA